MHCPYCGHGESRVLDSRPTDGGSAVRRRRECESCGIRFTTYERVEEVPLTVVKKDGTREPFDRNKLLGGLLRATVKREVPRVTLERLVQDIEEGLREDGIHEVPSQVLGEMVLDHLRQIDRVAYVRFASVYREFKDVDDFTDALKQLQKRRGVRRR